MIDSFDLICSHCDFVLENVSNGYPYVILKNGERHLLAAPHIDTDAEKATGQSYDELVEQNRLGELYHYICDDCASDALIDQNRDKIVCPECESQNLFTVSEMDQAYCPKCKSGQLSIQNYYIL